MHGRTDSETSSDITAIETLISAFADNYSRLVTHYFCAAAEVLRVQNKASEVAAELAIDTVRRIVKSSDDMNREMMTTCFENLLIPAKAYLRTAETRFPDGQNPTAHFIDEVLSHVEAVPEQAKASLDRVVHALEINFPGVVRDGGTNGISDSDRERASHEGALIIYVAPHRVMRQHLTVGRIEPEDCHYS